MDSFFDATSSRRSLIKAGLVIAGVSAIPAVARSPVYSVTPLQPAPPPSSPRVVRPELFRRAVASLAQHGERVEHHDRMAIADFAQASAKPRFHIVDLSSGDTTTFLVAHGSGSDPSHSGWLQRFSNDAGSNASCEGAFLAADYYVGKHGQSQRLIGLDPTNSNALPRAIVVHSAWYANDDMIPTHGMLGRSQGCFAVGEKYLSQVFARLGQGRMIYSAKV